jgi:hypothetical protein
MNRRKAAAALAPAPIPAIAAPHPSPGDIYCVLNNIYEVDDNLQVRRSTRLRLPHGAVHMPKVTQYT